MRLELISWNVHGPPLSRRRPQRLAAVAEVIREAAPDLVLLQEVWFPSDAERVVQCLPGYEPIAHGLRAGLLRRGGLLALLHRDRGWSYDSSRSGFESFRASAPLWRVWEGDALGRKGIHRIELVEDASGHRLVVLNTHLQAQYGTIRHEPPRRAQLEHLARTARAIDADLPVLAAGDFNTGPAEPVFDEVLRPHWHDLTESRRARPDAATHMDCGAEPPWIDYVLARRSDSWAVSADLDLIENTAPDEPWSDHHGLRATVCLVRAAGAPRSYGVRVL
jgi:endonuclease/exonuclease/phosphatase family metal-dependent hydrolase